MPFDGGNWQVTCKIGNTCTGRRPEGLASLAMCDGSLGARFAQMAHLEAASVPAFRRLERELRTLDAPRALVLAARDAARDEIRHARTMATFARKHGRRPERVAHAPFRARTLLELAIENAVEGCVRETLGAAQALAESVSAQDGDWRAAMASVAEDEVRHAELAHAVDAWARSRLDANSIAVLDRVQREAARALPPSPLAHALGMELGWLA
ncbi:MAG: hypothetical protein JST54_28870 [Deltaproteobacteria bacterium]|nr:hypothetical protein [Deltaproteobacteria bacterium]